MGRAAGLGTRAKDVRADAHVRGAKLDGRLEVGAHAHAEPSKAELACKFGKKRKMDAGGLLEGWDAHQSGDVELELFPTQPQQLAALGRQHACFLRLLAGIDLDEQLGAPPEL